MKTQVSRVSSGSDTSLRLRFKELGEELAHYGTLENVRIIPYRDPQLSYFQKLPTEMKAAVTGALESYVGICAQTRSRGHSLRNSRQLAWTALNAFKLRPLGDLFEFMQEHQVIEFYNSDNIQIFRNFVFFDLCSYTIEDLYCRPWFELFYREEQVTNSILGEFSKIFRGEKTATFEPDVPYHQLKEINSPFQHTVSMKLDFCSPLFSEGNVQDHLVVAESCSLESEALTEEEKEQRLREFYRKAGLPQLYEVEA